MSGGTSILCPRYLLLVVDEWFRCVVHKDPQGPDIVMTIDLCILFFVTFETLSFPKTDKTSDFLWLVYDIVDFFISTL